MLLYTILFISCVCISVVGYISSDKSLVSPLMLFSVAMMLASGLALIGTTDWNKDLLDPVVAIIVMVGFVAFVSGSLLTSNAYDQSHHFGDSKRNVIKWNACDIPIIIYVIAGLLLVFAFLLRVSETNALASSLGILSDNYFDTAYALRTKTANIFVSVDESAENSYSFLCNQLGKVATVLCHVSFFIAACIIVETNGQCIIKRLKKLLPVTICIVLASAYCISCSARSRILYSIIAFIVTLYCLLMFANYEKRELNRRFIHALLPIAVLICIVFFFSGGIVGRATNQSPLSYLSFYFGCGIPSFNSLYLHGMPETMFGEKSFYGLLVFLHKFNIVPNVGMFSPAWISLGEQASNVFTTFYAYYSDFGIAGIIFLSFAAGVLYTLIYHAALSASPYWLAIYTFCAPYILDAAREEFIFSRLPSLSYAAIAFLLIVAIYICFHVKQSKRLLVQDCRWEHISPYFNSKLNLKSTSKKRWKTLWTR